jgi:hypothetical protein
MIEFLKPFKHTPRTLIRETDTRLRRASAQFLAKSIQ